MSANGTLAPNSFRGSPSSSLDARSSCEVLASSSSAVGKNGR